MANDTGSKHRLQLWTRMSTVDWMQHPIWHYYIAFSSPFCSSAAFSSHYHHHHHRHCSHHHCRDHYPATTTAANTTTTITADVPVATTNTTTSTTYTTTPSTTTPTTAFSSQRRLPEPTKTNINTPQRRHRPSPLQNHHCCKQNHTIALPPFATTTGLVSC